MSDSKKPVQGKTEGNLEYRLRVKKWQRDERARKKREKEQVESPDKAEAAEPDESMRDTVENAWNKSAKYLDENDI
jgi:hypothetical protein